MPVLPSSLPAFLPPQETALALTAFLLCSFALVAAWWAANMGGPAVPPVRPFIVVVGGSFVGMFLFYSPGKGPVFLMPGCTLSPSFLPGTIVFPCLFFVLSRITGTRTAQLLAPAFHKTHRVLLIEKNSHFQHIFAFPRFSVTKGSSDPRWEPTSGNKDGSGIIDKRKAFIPFNPGTFKDCPEGSGWVAQAAATDFTRNKVKLDRKIELDGVFTDEVPYEYLVRWL